MVILYIATVVNGGDSDGDGDGDGGGDSGGGIACCDENEEELSSYNKLFWFWSCLLILFFTIIFWIIMEGVPFCSFV